MTPNPALHLDGRHICIVGAGAVGLFLTGLFGRFVPVTLLRKSPRTPTELSSLKVAGAVEWIVPSDNLHVVESAEISAIPQPALIFICVKAYDLREALERLIPSLVKDHTVIVCQNGLGVYQEAAELLSGVCPVLRMFPRFGVMCSGEFEVHLANSISLTFASTASDLPLRDDLVEMFRSLACEADTVDNIVLGEWQKLLLNLAVNPICTLLNRENGYILEQTELRRLVSALLSEARSVAAKEGFDLSHPSDDEIFQQIAGCRDNINSTLSDVRNSKRNDIDYILGRLLRLADAYEVAVPRCRTLYALLNSLRTQEDSDRREKLASSGAYNSNVK